MLNVREWSNNNCTRIQHTADKCFRGSVMFVFRFIFTENLPIVIDIGEQQTKNIENHEEEYDAHQFKYFQVLRILF